MVEQRKDCNVIDENQERAEKIIELSKKVIDVSYQSILMEMMFFDMALSRLIAEPDDNLTYLGTNGRILWYNPLKTMESYKKNTKEIPRDLVHIIIHFLFGHPFMKVEQNHLWDVSCDIVAEQILISMKGSCIQCNDKNTLKKKDIVRRLERIVRPFTPVKLYEHLQSAVKPEVAMGYRDLFLVDDHSLWHQSEKSEEIPDQDCEIEDGENAEIQNNQSTNTIQNSSIQEERLAQEWKNVSQDTLNNMETTSNLYGDTGGNMVQKLKNFTRKPVDYQEFLKKFVSLREQPKINDDEFDYIFYTYGLKMYQNMPLIEPLEYKETNLIEDFVIAIDTSGSTVGDVVQSFLEKTYQILQSANTFGKNTNIYILQCDTKIHEIVHISSKEIFKEYIENLKLKGGGGTNFTPVFDHVNKMVKENAFKKLKGLLYFTDGYGIFPKEKTPYDTVFVFVQEEDFSSVTVPPWAMKVLLTEDEVREFKKERK